MEIFRAPVCVISNFVNYPIECVSSNGFDIVENVGNVFFFLLFLILWSCSVVEGASKVISGSRSYRSTTMDAAMRAVNF